MHRKTKNRGPHGLVIVAVLCGFMLSCYLGYSIRNCQPESTEDEMDAGFSAEYSLPPVLAPLSPPIDVTDFLSERSHVLAEAEEMLEGNIITVGWNAPSDGQVPEEIPTPNENFAHSKQLSEPDNSQCAAMWASSYGRQLNTEGDEERGRSNCQVNGSGSCGLHGKCFIGLCVCSAGYLGSSCNGHDATVFASRSHCCGMMLSSERYDDLLNKCRLRLEVAHNVTSASARKGIVGKAAAGNSPCGHMLARFDVCHNWNQNAGVSSISFPRWKLAQLFETTTWEQMSKTIKGGVKEDREGRHLVMFDDYRSLFVQQFERVLEIGCGPFTQSYQLFKKTRAVITKELVLLDPLMEDYLSNVKNCRYLTMARALSNFDSLASGANLVLLHAGGEAIVDGALVSRIMLSDNAPSLGNHQSSHQEAPSRKPSPSASRLLPSRVSANKSFRKKKGVLRSTTMKFARRRLLNEAEEDPSMRTQPYQFHAGSFDLVVIINVLEHCRDALEVLQNAHNAVAPGGYLVIHDRFADDLWSIYFSGKSLRTPDEYRRQAWEEEIAQAGGIERLTKNLPFWDVGHPLNLMRSPFSHLFRQYDVVHQRYGTFAGHKNSQEFYFIGKKKKKNKLLTGSSLDWFS